MEVKRRMCSLVNWHFMFLVRHSVHEFEPVASHLELELRQIEAGTFTLRSLQASQLGSFLR